MKKRKNQSAAQKAWRKFAGYSRVIHIYLSTCLFTLVILFSITGIILNHIDWLDGDSYDGAVEKELTEQTFNFSAIEDESKVLSDISLDGIKQLLKSEYQLTAVSSIEYDDDMGEIILYYKIPGGYASAVVITEDRVLSVDFRQGSAWSIMSDLHKGRHSGIVWSWVIDISAALMVIFSMTGLIILFQHKKHRVRGVVFAIAGTITPFIIYWFFVPKITGV